MIRMICSGVAPVVSIGGKVSSYLLFPLFLVMSFSCFGQQKEKITDSILLNNAAISMRYYEQLYLQPPYEPDQNINFWNRAIVILNGERILDKEDFWSLEKSRIVSVKRMDVVKENKDLIILLVKTKGDTL